MVKLVQTTIRSTELSIAYSPCYSIVLMCYNSKLLDLNKFYTINITRGGNVTLQGDFDKEVVKWAIHNRFVIKVNGDMGYISFTRGKIEINLL